MNVEQSVSTPQVSAPAPSTSASANSPEWLCYTCDRLIKNKAMNERCVCKSCDDKARDCFKKGLDNLKCRNGDKECEPMDCAACRMARYVLDIILSHFFSSIKVCLFFSVGMCGMESFPGAIFTMRKQSEILKIGYLCMIPLIHSTMKRDRSVFIN